MIIELSGAINPTELAEVLDCVVVLDGPLRVRCAVGSTPERITAVTTYLTSVQVTMVSLRTRASLEERYLELIADERSGLRQ
jgi:hypothetical protein